MVDIFVGDAGLGEGLGAGDAEGARGGEVPIWLTIGVWTLSPVPSR
jgi:hypothetical protein